MATLPKRRIGTFTGWILIGFFAFTDILQIVLDLFGIGLIANNFIDIGVAFFLLIFLFIKDIPVFSDWRIFTAVSIALIGENIPILLLEVAPFWSLDVWYIVHRVQKEDKTRIAQAQAEIQKEEERLQQQRIMQLQLRNRYLEQEGYDEAA